MIVFVDKSEILNIDFQFIRDSILSLGKNKTLNENIILTFMSSVTKFYKINLFICQAK
jgi:hypothetical protein